MAKEWIKQLAEEIRTKEHTNATNLAKQEHIAAVIAEKGPSFFAEVVTLLREDISELNNLLEGDVTARKTTTTPLGGQPNAQVIMRDNVPAVSAQMMLNAKGIAVTSKNVKTDYVFHVGEHDGLSVRGSFGQQAGHYDQPADFSKYLMESLFKV